MAGKQLTTMGERSNVCLERLQRKTSNQWEPTENIYCNLSPSSYSFMQFACSTGFAFLLLSWTR